MTIAVGSASIAEFEGVTKWYGPVIGVNDVRVTIQSGITGLVGTNGAGKTTLIKLLTGHLRPTLGQVRIGSYDAWSSKAKQRVGYCPEVDTLYEEMTGRSFLTTMARLHGWTGSGTARPCRTGLAAGRDVRPGAYCCRRDAQRECGNGLNSRRHWCMIPI